LKGKPLELGKTQINGYSSRIWRIPKSTIKCTGEKNVKQPKWFLTYCRGLPFPSGPKRAGHVRMVGKNLAVKDTREVSQGHHTLFLFF
jgi:hypothetical protein